MTGLSAVRNTCFAILSAIETDLRELIEHDLPPIKGDHFLPSDVRSVTEIRYAFDNKNAPHRSEGEDVELLTYADFGDLAKIVRPVQKELSESHQSDFAKIADEIERFVPIRNRVCHSRPLEEDDLAQSLDFGKSILAAHSSLPWTALRETQDLLAKNPGFVLSLEIPGFWQVGSAAIRHNLPLPDYDETSFLGRVADRREIRKHLLAAHPVITIVGEGGVGKSAIAVHCLYDLLSITDSPPYDAIIWTSLKTKTLTPAGVTDIKDAITSTIGIIENAARELGSPFDSDQSLEASMEDVLEYMRLFKILLVVDNYETVTDKSLRPLLTSIPIGSKVLLTSRVGLGELEIRYKLDPLDLKTSVSLMRRFAKSLNVEMLYTATDKKLERYCDFLYFNPLLIKWFTQSVSMGADPEKLATKGNPAFNTVIHYCFENLFSRLKEEERKVLHFLAASRRPLTPTELLFLMQKISDISASRLDEALSTLHSSSMLKRTPLDSKGSDGTIQISLTDVASDYIARFAPPEKGIFEKIQVASKQLRQQIQLSSVRQATYKFDLFSVRAKTTDQRISAFHLNAALEFSKVRDYEGARKSVAEAKMLLPSFAEAYRISALIESKDGELYKATQEIEEAAQYDPHSAIIHYQYASLLLYQLEDLDGALVECERAIKCDPNEEALSTLKALILTRLGRYPEAAPMYDALLMDIANRPHKWRISTRDQAAECYRRFGEQDRVMKDNGGFIRHINRACTIIEEAMAVGDVDRRTGILYSNVIEDALYFALAEKDETYGRLCFSRLSDASHLLRMPVFRTLKLEYFETAFGADSVLTRTAKSYFERHSRLDSVVAMMKAESSESRVIGKIKAMPFGKNFGFATDRDGNDWFLSRSFLRDPKDWTLLREGTLVQFSPRFDARERRQAQDLVIL